MNNNNFENPIMQDSIDMSLTDANEIIYLQKVGEIIKHKQIDNIGIFN